MMWYETQMISYVRSGFTMIHVNKRTSYGLKFDPTHHLKPIYIFWIYLWSYNTMHKLDML